MHKLLTVCLLFSQIINASDLGAGAGAGSSAGADVKIWNTRPDLTITTQSRTASTTIKPYGSLLFDQATPENGLNYPYNLHNIELYENTTGIHGKKHIIEITNKHTKSSQAIYLNKRSGDRKMIGIFSVLATEPSNDTDAVFCIDIKPPYTTPGTEKYRCLSAILYITLTHQRGDLSKKNIQDILDSIGPKKY